MKVIIEGNEVELELPRKDVKLRELADEVEEFLFGLGKVPVGLTIDGLELTQEEYEKRQEETIAGTETFDFTVVSMLQFLNDNLDGAQNANEIMIESIRGFCEQIRSGKEDAEGQHLVVEMQNFFDFWLKLNQLLPESMERVDFGGKKMTEILDGIRELLQEIVGAMEDQDFVLATDLFEFEVIPLLEEVAQGVPALKEDLRNQEVVEEVEPSHDG